MDFDQLETFLEVAKLSSFSRAAERRFRTQPAISSQIRGIEEEVGATVADAVEFARSSPYPVYEEAFDHVFGERVPLPEDPIARG